MSNFSCVFDYMAKNNKVLLYSNLFNWVKVKRQNIPTQNIPTQNNSTQNTESPKTTKPKKTQGQNTQTPKVPKIELYKLNN